MKRIIVLGSTGSIGKNTLSLVKDFPSRFRIVGLSTNSNVGLLAVQAKRYRPSHVCISDENAYRGARARFPSGVRILRGAEGLSALCRSVRADLVVMAITGSAALEPLLAAIDEGMEVALANKESLVMAGALLMRRAQARGVRIIPVDSEQSAIWQCLSGQQRKALKKIYLTASGGPFLAFPKSRLRRISLRQALRHPRWKMGTKITIDSATLMNKGLEVIEAMQLFSLTSRQVEAVIHPEAIIHSMVEFIDGSVLAQLSVTDMRIPIQYALTYPKRLENNLGRLDFCALKQLNFHKPDFERFPCLALAYRAARQAGTAPCVLNAANEIAVEAFVEGSISFTGIPDVIEQVLDAHSNIAGPTLQQIWQADAWAKAKARKVISHG